jgi:hypothetical protein
MNGDLTINIYSSLFWPFTLLHSVALSPVVSAHLFCVSVHFRPPHIHLAIRICLATAFILTAYRKPWPFSYLVTALSSTKRNPSIATILPLSDSLEHQNLKSSEFISSRHTAQKPPHQQHTLLSLSQRQPYVKTIRQKTTTKTTTTTTTPGHPSKFQPPSQSTSTRP